MKNNLTKFKKYVTRMRSYSFIGDNLKTTLEYYNNVIVENKLAFMFFSCMMGFISIEQRVLLICCKNATPCGKNTTSFK